MDPIPASGRGVFVLRISRSAGNHSAGRALPRSRDGARLKSDDVSLTAILVLGVARSCRVSKKVLCTEVTSCVCLRGGGSLGMRFDRVLFPEKI